MSENRRQAVPNYLSLKLCDELYGLIAAESDKTGQALIEIAVRKLAESYKRPELGYVPRKKLGRPRRERAAV